MSDSPGIMATEGLSDATDAFAAVLDAETPTRSRRTREKREESKTDIDDLFPNRQMDRREKEGGADDDPEIVKQARREARQQQGESDTPPRDPIEGDDEDEAEDDDELPDDDGEPDEQEEDEGERESAELDPNLTVQVTVDGQPVEVTIEEALKGYIRQETFHRRMGELGQGVQQLQTERVQIQQNATALAERAAAMETLLEAVMPQEPDWNVLFAADPAKAAHLKFQWEQFTDKIQGVAQHRQASIAQAQAMQMRQLHDFANANRTWLAQAHPEWKDEKRWKRDHDSMRRTAISAGYTDAEIAQLYDARAVTVLLKAAAYDRMMAKKPQPVRQGYAPSKRNGSTPRNLSRSFDRAEKRLSRSGSVNDAAAVFERILDNER